jgi:gamma-glutamyltranspeptidase
MATGARARAGARRYGVRGARRAARTRFTVKEKAETTHYSVVDSEGNAVVVTYTINDGFGAGVIRPGPASC